MHFVAIDWARSAHVAVALDESGRQTGRRRVASTRADIDAFFAYLAELGGTSGVRIAVESGAGLLLDLLLARGYWVCVLNPKQSERLRDRLSVSGAKDDARDALALAEALRTDAQGRLRPAAHDLPCVEELRLLDAARQRAVADRVALSNQLGENLLRWIPGLLALGRACDDPFLLDLLRACDPASADVVCTRRVGALRRRHRVRSLAARDVVAVLRRERFEAPQWAVHACRREALQIADRIGLLHDQVEELDKEIERLFESHPDREILESVPGLAKVLAPRVGARLGSRHQGRQVRLVGGTAPVTRQSGERSRGGRVFPGSRSVRMRRCCDRVLQTALYSMARATARTTPWAKAFYRSQVDRGVARAAAIRALSNKWAKILQKLLADRRTYDEATHVASLKRNRVAWAKSLQTEASAA